MADVVQSVLEKVSAEAAKYKSTNVTKDIDIELDLGNLQATDVNELKETDLRYFPNHHS